MITDNKESFSIYKGEMNGRPVFAMVDTRYKDFKEKKFYPWFLSISTSLENPTQEGLTTNEEAEVLNDFEDNLLLEIKDVVPFCFLGRATWNGYREIFLYVKEPEVLSKKLQEIIDSKKYRGFAFRCERDDDWNKVQIYFE